MKREIQQIVTGNRAIDGAGVNLVRVLGKETMEAFDPFLMLDAFDSTNPDDYTKGFPWHPHRGIETVTYLVQGKIEHQDSLGNKGDIVDGSCQWMTAGSGILHQEMPIAAERMWGLQLWLNLPQQDKMTPPKYNDIRPEEVPEVKEDGAVVRVISGQFRDAKARMKGEHVAMTMLDIALEPGKAFSVETPEDTTVFVYLMAGSARFGTKDEEVQEKRAVLFTQGSELSLVAGEQGLRMVMCQGKPLDEPIAWGGPIVMNTRQELQLAFAELDRGTFIKS